MKGKSVILELLIQSCPCHHYLSGTINFFSDIHVVTDMTVLKVKAISIVMNITNQPICLQQMFHSNYTPPLYPSVKAHLYVLNIYLALFVNILSLLFNPLPSPLPPPPQI